jgi:hypothetical protein
MIRWPSVLLISTISFLSFIFCVWLKLGRVGYREFELVLLMTGIVMILLIVGDLRRDRDR